MPCSRNSLCRTPTAAVSADACVSGRASGWSGCSQPCGGEPRPYSRSPYGEFLPQL